ncbi:MAG: HAD family phosphatase [Oscillospiraceae bacterium]|jgi:hypothetical protein|nr:HAD family phosphatase [Oscillospiraceae bacterium]
MQSYSIVLLDIDGTLIDDERKISTNTKCLLERLEKQGIPVILCSERYPDGVEFFVHQANLHSPIVCYSGNLILDSNRSILQDYGIKTSDAISFKKYANKYFPKVVVSTYLYNVWLVDDADHPVIHMEANMIQCVPLCAPIENALRNSDHVHRLSCIGSPQEISALQKSASPLFEDIQFLHSGPTSLEVLKKGISKKTAAEYLQKHYNIPRERIVACGDQMVDLEMLEYAGFGIAMGNAPEQVKNAADCVTASNKEEGVYIALRRLRFKPPLVPVSAI